MTKPAAIARWREAFDGRARRERVLLIGAAVALCWMAADALWVAPAFASYKQAQARLSLAQNQVTTLNADAARVDAEARSAEQRLRDELARLREQVATSERELHAAGAALVPAREIVPVLDRLLAQSAGLKLRSMQTLGRDPVRAGAAASAPAADAALYRHGVELGVEGSYADLLAYVKAIEALPQRVLWGGLQLKVEQYPKVLLTLRLYTLSQDRTWLEI